MSIIAVRLTTISKNNSRPPTSSKIEEHLIVRSLIVTALDMISTGHLLRPSSVVEVVIIIVVVFEIRVAIMLPLSKLLACIRFIIRLLALLDDLGVVLQFRWCERRQDAVVKLIQVLDLVRGVTVLACLVRSLQSNGGRLLSTFCQGSKSNDYDIGHQHPLSDSKFWQVRNRKKGPQVRMILIGWRMTESSQHSIDRRWALRSASHVERDSICRITHLLKEL